MKFTNILLNLVLFLLGSAPLLFAQNPVPPGALASFTSPDTVCINSPVNIVNTSAGATTYYWNFCTADLNTTPSADNMGNISGNLSEPVFMDYVFVNNNYYGFLVNFNPGGLIRLDFGNSLLNTPTSVNLGNFGGIIPSGRGAEGIQVIQNEGKWYAIIVGGHALAGSTPKILKIDFGTDITNPAPIATDWGNIGNLSQPMDLHIFQENGNWYGFTVNSEDNTITRFNFTNSFDNTPTAVNLGNLGDLAYPTGIYVIDDNGNWRLFIVNAGNTSSTGIFSLSRLDFGSSLLNTPTATNLGNPGNTLFNPRDLTIMKSCEQIVGFVVNGDPVNHSLVKFDFNNDLSSVPVSAPLGDIGNLNFPHSISKLFRVKDDIYGFILNVANNTITRLQFSGCTNASMPSSSDQTPPPITYNKPGTYNINLTIDDGLPTQSSFCKQVTVLPAPDFTFSQDICNPLSVRFTSADGSSLDQWSFGDGNSISGVSDPVNLYTNYAEYTVKLDNGGRCAVSKQVLVSILNEDIILTPDTTICTGSSKQLRSKASLSFCWSPATYLDNPLSPNPVTSTPTDITYYLNAQVIGNNIIKNGDFSGGNADFTSEYSFANPNSTEGQYSVGSNPQSWNNSMSNCVDHTSGSGNMMLINGAPQADVNVWTQTIAITPNTNYAFSTWVQALGTANPAMLRFSINGNDLGDLISASLPACSWTQFYAVWNSGNNTSAVISIVNKNTQIQGNDFALDDISFAPVYTRRDSVIIKVEKPVVRTIADTLVCSGSPVQLNASGAASYQWSPVSGLSGAGIANPIAVTNVPVQYIVSGTTVHGCVAKDTMQISIKPLPVIQLTGDTLVCIASPTQLLASGAVAYSWFPATGLDHSDQPDPVATVLSNTTYTVTATGNNGCTATDSVKLSVRPYPEFSASRSQDICIGSDLHLYAKGGDTYQWQPAASLDDASSSTPVASPDITTNFNVHISEKVCNYDTTINLVVTVNPVPDIQIQKSNDINCNTPAAQLNASGALTYQWIPSEGLDNPIIPNPIATTEVTTRFEVKGFNKFGCSSSSFVTVNAATDGIPRFIVPNAFTPNNDNKNDCFGIKRWGNAKIALFSIYNRWGQLVFQTNNPSQCWDGTFKGKVQDAGNFVYIIKAQTLCGLVTRKGSLLLIR